MPCRSALLVAVDDRGTRSELVPGDPHRRRVPVPSSGSCTTTSSGSTTVSGGSPPTSTCASAPALRPVGGRMRHRRRGRAVRPRHRPRKCARRPAGQRLRVSGLVGGAAAYSGGQVWVGANHVAARKASTTTSSERERYVRAIAGAHPELLDEQAMQRWFRNAGGHAALGDRGCGDVGADRGLADYPRKEGALSLVGISGCPCRRACSALAQPAAGEPVLPDGLDLRRHHGGGSPPASPMRRPTPPR